MEIVLSVPDAVDRLQRRLKHDLVNAVEEWSSFVSTLSRWEDDHLLDDPTPELLADHKATLERFLEFGRFLSLVTADPEFKDRGTAEMVAATQVVLQDKLRMWHGPQMSRAQSDRILAEVFPDEP